MSTQPIFPFADSILFRKLEERSHKKAELIKDVYEKFKDKIEAINKLFSSFTNHDIDHCKSVIKILEKLVIGEDLLENSSWKEVRGRWRLYLKDAYLTEDEMTLLLLAILLHDIGMSPKIDDRLRELLDRAKFGEVEKDKIDEIKHVVRETHHIRSREFIEKNKDLKDLMRECGFDEYVDALADVVEGHRIDPFELFSRFRYKIYDVRVPLLAFLLEIADDMDIGSHRVDRFISEDWIWFYLNRENIKHILANMSVKKFYREGDRVEYEVHIKDVEEYRFLELVYKWWDKIENRINRFGLVGSFREHEDVTAWRYVLPSKVEFKVKAKGIDADWSKKFEVDRYLLADLLSSRVYGNEWMYAFGELIGNCFDAIKMRAYDESFDPKVKIDVKLKGDWVEIFIEDNGIGMSLRDVEDYLLKVGRSLYRELMEEHSDKAKAISPIGYYGIGFLSSFMLLRNEKGEFEGCIEVESKKKGYDAVKVLILNPNLPVLKFKSDREEVETVVKIKCRNREVKEFFEHILRFVKLCKANGIDVRVFPFFSIEIKGEIITLTGFGIINSVFEVGDRKLEIPIVLKIEDVEIWNGCIKPELFIISIINNKEGEILKNVEVKHESGTYQLEIWEGTFIYLEFMYPDLYSYSLIPVDQLISRLLKVTEVASELKSLLGADVFISKITSVNGIMCKLKNNKYFDVFRASEMNGKPITWILNMNLKNPNYIDLKKTEIEIPKEVLGELFKKLKDSGLVLYLINSPSVKDKDFEEIRTIDFVKSCLKFKDLYGNYLTLDEIEKMGKKPVVVDVEPIEMFKDEFENLWNKLHPLSGKYSYFLTMIQKVSDFFEGCEECENKDIDCVFKWRGYYITNSNFRDLCLGKDIIAVDKHSFILDNPFVKAICEMWKNGEITLNEIKPIFEEIDKITSKKGYATVKDIEELANKDEDVRKCYELIKRKLSDIN